jgi:DNA-binding NarL/FixJ family response regulator
MIRVLIVDDQPLVRTGLRVLLEAEPDIEVVAEAGDGAEAVTLATRLHPEVVLMDIRMPVMDGIEAAAEIARRGLLARVLLVTTFDPAEYLDAARAAGASRVLLKDEAPEVLAGAVRTLVGPAPC